MNSKASRITFCVTWVVDRIVVTHFRKPVEGEASGTKAIRGRGENRGSSILESVGEDSNQKRQVIYHCTRSAMGPEIQTWFALTCAANSVKLPLVELIVAGSCRYG